MLSTHSRRLVAIMFTDIAGYTALMQKSEHAAVQTRQRHRAVFEPTTAKHEGKIIQYYGDGTLSIFESSVSAVRCAIELQQQFLEEPAIPVRIGIHTGDILISEVDIIGDSVNLASRVESMGVPGSVVISGKVAEEIKNQDDLPIRLLGSFHFKNDARKREVYALDIPGLVIPQKEHLQGKLQTSKGKPWFTTWRTLLIPIVAVMLAGAAWLNLTNESVPQIHRLAVMPFFNRMNVPEQNQLIDGVHEALISELQQAGLTVKARTSMIRYRGTEKPVEKISNELDVQALVEGSVFRADDTLGIRVQLINGVTGNVLWSETFENDFRNIMVLYSDVTREIAHEINQALEPQVVERLENVHPIDPEAYKAYLKGQQFWYGLNKKALETSQKYFELALDNDPEYAPAHAGIAAVWVGRLQQGFVSHAEALPFIIDASSKARELGSEQPEVQFWLGTISTWVLCEWEPAEKAYRKSLALNSSYADAHAYYSHFLYIMNRPEEATAHIEKAIELDPFNPLFQALYGMGLNYSGRHDEVIQRLTATLSDSPNDPVALSTLRTSYHLAGRYEDAIYIWKKFYTGRKDSAAVEVLNTGFTEGGYTMALQRLAEMLIERSQSKYVTPWQISTLYTRAGKNEEALDWLEKAYEAHDSNMPYISIDPIFDGLRDEPRFQELIQKMKLPTGDNSILALL